VSCVLKGFEQFFGFERPAALSSRSKTFRVGDASATLHLGDAIEWMNGRKARSIQAIVTDPPYGLLEYTKGEQKKLRRGRGGVWRIPPKLDGYARSPVPRFTVLGERDRKKLEEFFERFARAAMRVLVPGGHVFIATNPLLSALVYRPLALAGFEPRGEIIRLVQTLRGGDRPKNAHREFENVTVLPRSAFEPWGLFRKPCEGRVEDNLRRFRTGGLRRPDADSPFADVIKSAPTRASERALSRHPSLKPQAFMRAVVRAALPLGKGTVLDPFAGGGSTLAAALAVGYSSIGVETDRRYFGVAARGIPKLARLKT
jgi:site-specific DNA-methyltransferase (adenine-specific)